MEDDGFVDAVDEFRAEMRRDDFHHFDFHGFVVVLRRFLDEV